MTVSGYRCLGQIGSTGSRRGVIQTETVRQRRHDILEYKLAVIEVKISMTISDDNVSDNVRPEGSDQKTAELRRFRSTEHRRIGDPDNTR
jgi:hypothetical protein